MAILCLCRKCTERTVTWLLSFCSATSLFTGPNSQRWAVHSLLQAWFFQCSLSFVKMHFAYVPQFYWGLSLIPGSLSSQKSHTTKLKNCMSFRLFCADIWCEPRKTEKSVIFQFSGRQVKEKALVKAKGEERSEWGVSRAALSWIFSWWHEMSEEKFAVLTVTWRSSCPLWAKKDKSSRSDEYCRSLEEGQKVKN